MSIYRGTKKTKLYIGNKKVKYAYLGNKKVYSAGNIVTYRVDSNTVYHEEVDSGVSCLSPKTFIPAKSGWTFLGWRTDTSATWEVLSTKIMGDEPITLYAVFAQVITVTYYSVSVANATDNVYQISDYKYYNNGTIVNPKFTITPFGYGSEWTFRGWTTSVDANASITYSSINNREFSSNETLYILLQRPVTLYYNGNSATSGSVASETKYVYLNSYNGNTQIAPPFTLKANGFTRTGFDFVHWLLNGSTAYGVGTTITLWNDATCYAGWTTQVHYVFNGGVVDSVNWLYQLDTTHYGNLMTGEVKFDDEGDDEGESNTYTFSISDYIRLRVDADAFGSSGVILTESPIDVSNFNRCDIVWDAITDSGAWTTETSRYIDLCWGDTCNGSAYGSLRVPANYTRRYHYELSDTLSWRTNTIDISSINSLYIGLYNSVGNNGCYIDGYIKSIRLYNA